MSVKLYKQFDCVATTTMYELRDVGDYTSRNILLKKSTEIPSYIQVCCFCDQKSNIVFQSWQTVRRHAQHLKILSYLLSAYVFLGTIQGEIQVHLYYRNINRENVVQEKHQKSCWIKLLRNICEQSSHKKKLQYILKNQHTLLPNNEFRLYLWVCVYFVT